VLKSFYVTILAARSMHVARNFSRLQNARPSYALSLVYRCITESAAFHVKHCSQKDLVTSFGNCETFVETVHTSVLSQDKTPVQGHNSLVSKQRRKGHIMQNTTQTIKNNVKTIVRTSHAPKALRAIAARDAFIACRQAMDMYLTGYQQLILASNFTDQNARDAFSRLSKMAADVNWQATCCDWHVPSGRQVFARI
jgi:hypothetical protein